MGVRYWLQPGAGRKKYICGARNSPAKMLPSVRPVTRSMPAGVQHQAAEAGEVRLEHGLRLVAEPLPLALPVAALELVRRVLDEARHHVLPGRRHVGVAEP